MGQLAMVLSCVANAFDYRETQIDILHRLRKLGVIHIDDDTRGIAQRKEMVFHRPA
jgi:hypothetical protein